MESDRVLHLMLTSDILPHTLTHTSTNIYAHTHTYTVCSEISNVNQIYYFFTLIFSLKLFLVPDISA